MVDGIIDVCPQLGHVASATRVYIPPFFDEERFLNYRDTSSRYKFFLQNFGITINDSPIICMVGNFYANPLYKNHQLLLHAAALLLHERKRNFQIVLAGSGERLQECQELARTLHIAEHVHFLGATNNIPGILFHSNMHVLPSIQEAFGIVLLEAAQTLLQMLPVAPLILFAIKKQEFYLKTTMHRVW